MDPGGTEPMTVGVGSITVRYLHADPSDAYALLEWTAPAGSSSPPVHIHHGTDEGFYVLRGTFRFQVDGRIVDGPPGTHVLVRQGLPHTFWNPGSEPATCLIVLAPPEFAPYFRELAESLGSSPSDDEAIRVRRELSSRYDIEVVGPPVTP